MERRRRSSEGEEEKEPRWSLEMWQEERKRRLEEQEERDRKVRLDSTMSFSIDGGSILEVQRENRKKWEEVRKACGERKAFLEAEVERIRAQEVTLRQFRVKLRADLEAEEIALGVVNSQLANLDSILPEGAASSWALETSAACSCQGACNCIQVR